MHAQKSTDDTSPSRPDRKQSAGREETVQDRLVTLKTLQDNAPSSSLPPAVYAHILVESDGFDLSLYRSPQDRDNAGEPLARVLIEYHNGEIRAYLYPAGVFPEDEPGENYKLADVSP